LARPARWRWPARGPGGCPRRDAAGIRQTVGQIAQSGGAGFAVQCDVCDPSSVKAARDATRAHFGDPQVLVNVAGVVRRGAMEILSLKDWNDVLAINLTGYFVCAQVFAEMRAEAKA
jgi:NAD(P)-dependent dehydrogenase (short-subunit alcohol dehydrogenase family)